jgi:hypothetical protein
MARRTGGVLLSGVAPLLTCEKSGAGDGNRTRMTSLEVECRDDALTRGNVYQRVRVGSARTSPPFPAGVRPIWHGSGTRGHPPARCSPVSTLQMSVTSVTPVTCLVRGGVERLPPKLLRLHPAVPAIWGPERLKQPGV